MRKREFYLIGLMGVAFIAIVGFLSWSSVVEHGKNAVASNFKQKTTAILPVAPGTSSGKNEGEAGKPATSTAAWADLLGRTQLLRQEKEWESALTLIRDGKSWTWTSEERAEVAKFMAAKMGLLDELRRLAEIGGPVQALDFSKGFHMELPHLAPLRFAARLLAADAALRASNGDYVGAVEDLTAAMKLANNVAQEPLLSSQLVRFAMDDIASSAIENVVTGGELSPELYRTLIAQAAAAAGREAFAQSFLGEATMGIDTFGRIRTGEYPLNEFRSFYHTESPEGPQELVDAALSMLYTSPAGQPFMNLDEQTYTETMLQLSEAVQRPYYEAQPRIEALANETGGGLSFLKPISNTLVPSFEGILDAQALHEARMGLMQVGLAVELYHAQNGQYPSSLEAVAPILAGNVPVDPFTGQPFVYQPSGDSFTLYSARGSTPAPARRPNHHPRGADAQGNIVWRGEEK